MRTVIFRSGVSLALFLAVVAATTGPATARGSRATRAAQAHATPTLRAANAPGMVGHGPAAATPGTESRRVFVVVPGFVGPIFWDPFWPADPWNGWWGPAPYATVQVVPTDVARFSLHVRPRKADLIVDGSDLGEARDYTADYHPLWLSPGPHALELRFPGYQTLRVRLDVQKGQIYDLHYRLYPGEGIDRRSSKGWGRASRAPGEHASN